MTSSLMSESQGPVERSVDVEDRRFEREVLPFETTSCSLQFPDDVPIGAPAKR